MKRIFAFLFLFVTALSVSYRAQAQPLPLHLTQSKLAQLRSDDILVVKGTVDNSTPVIFAVRIDDASSNNYGSRVNIERSLPAGEFTFELPLGGVRTINGRVLDLENLRNMYLFGAAGAKITLTSLEFKKAVKIPNSPVALSFGAANSPLFQGFERVTGEDPRIQGKTAPILRPGGDALISSGLRGVTGVKLPFAEGRATLTLYLEDIGAWETLPAVLKQRIRVNGQDISLTDLTPEEWIKTRYIRNGAHEPTLPLNAYHNFGARRGGRLQVPVTIGKEGLSLEIAGEGAQATFISALILEKGEQPLAATFVESERERLYNAIWRISDVSASFPKPYFDFAKLSTAQLNVDIAPDTAERVSFSLVSATPMTIKDIKLEGGKGLKARIWAGQRRLIRRKANDTLLDYGTGFWRADVTRLPLSSEPRPYLIWLEVEKDAPKGKQEVQLRINGQPLRINVTVLPVTLPQAEKSAGFYHDEAPHLLYFPATRVHRQKQIICDVDFMRSLGINGIAPSLSVFPEEFTGDFAAVKDFTPPYLAYTPAKRILETYGAQKGAAMVAALDHPHLLWSIADEPSNHDVYRGDLSGFIAGLRKASPNIKLAAQLNTPKDVDYLSNIDVALVNDGFGVDTKDVQKIIMAGKIPWFYNLGTARPAAGLWLFRSQAKAYVQWHARMPTADPFDPTDGREGDVQVFLPQGEICPAQPDVSDEVFQMAEGVIDQRYLQLGRKLKTSITFPQTWEETKHLTPEQLNTMRKAVVQTAIQK